MRVTQRFKIVLEGFINVSAILRCGVYALVREGVVVYVGQSKKPLARVSAHRSNWGRKAMPAWMPASLRGVLFDEVHVLPCKVEQLNELEKALINLYKPKYNIALKAPTPVEIAHLFPQAPAQRFERRI